MLVTAKSVHLKNFRGFRDHRVSLSPTTVLVGQNNAGKSTFIDGLRILAIAVRKARTARYGAPPDWLSGTAVGFGYRISFETIDFDFSNIQYNHNRDEPATLTLTYSNGVTLKVWLGQNPQENFCQVVASNGESASSGLTQSALKITPIYVMPPVQALVAHEKRISKSRIEEFMYGRLASRHFRNQLYEKVPEYRIWKNLLIDTWPTVAVSAFDHDVGESGTEFSLILREGPFASEAAWVGGGLQAWMQILWFLCRTPKDTISVLDEPDIYLHADMQRKLIKLLGDRGNSQTIIATHSTEIISDTPPDTICVIRKRERNSFRPLTKTKLQTVIDGLGSRYNIQLSKLAEARKMVVYEGEDQKFLSEAAFKIDSECYDKFIKVPTFELGGVTNWQQAFGAAKALAVASDESMPVHLVIDRDFRDEEDVNSIKEKCSEFNIILHVLKRKEIENYFIDASALSRFLTERGSVFVSKNDAQSLIDLVGEELRSPTIAAIADYLQQKTPRLAPSTAFKAASLSFINEQNSRRLQDIVSGKSLISLLSKHSKERYDVSFGAMTLCKAMLSSEFDPEIVELIKGLS